MGLELGLLGIIVLLLDLWAIFHIVQSRISPFGKALWVVGILIFQILGFLVWLFFGPRANR
jgi:hypothetical protein